jgi:protein-S-isoprenylcysteine O-methyltransferase Ste14
MGRFGNIMQDHRKRDDLAGEHRLGDLGQIGLLAIFLAVWIYDSFFTQVSIFWAEDISLAVRAPIAGILIVFSGYLAFSGLGIVFGEVRETPSVIRKGVFKMVRHPMYLGAVLTYIGLFLLTMSLLSLGVIVIILIFYNIIARHEELLLTEKYGTDYEKYMQSVPRWFPMFMRNYK